MANQLLITLTAMARCLYPHDVLVDTPYQRVALIIASVPERQNFLRANVAALNNANGGSFAALSESAQVNALKEIEGTHFFEEVRAATVRHLYSDPEVWHQFGYEGPSHHLGGYIRRGFDEAPWLPEEELDDA